MSKLAHDFSSSSGEWRANVGSTEESGVKIKTILRLRGQSIRARSRRCDDNKTRAVLSQTWVYDSCTLPSLVQSLETRQVFLRQAQPILWVGDSLLGQFYCSFTDLTQLSIEESQYSRSYILVDPYSLDVVNSTSYNACQKHRETCPRGTNEYQIFSVPNVTLPSHRSVKDLVWGSLLQEKVFNTLILNVGHHWWKETSSISAEFEPGTNAFTKYSRMVEGVARFLMKIKYSGQVLYITSPPGFPNCDEEWRPNELPATMNNPYHWSKPARREHLWVDTFKRLASTIRFHVLNITQLSLTRGDAHPNGDCLHYCQIGVPDEWSRVLLGALNKLHTIVA